MDFAAKKLERSTEGRKIPSHLIPCDTYLDGKLLAAAAGRFGTPLYIYDREIARRDYSNLLDLLPDETKIFYSVKANPAPALVGLFSSLGAGMEVSSIGEMEVVKRAVGSLSETSFVGPGKGDDELRFALDEDVGLIVVESKGEFERLRDVCRKRGKSTRILLRVNPGFGKGALSMSGVTQFGMEPKDAEELLNREGDGNLVEIVGIHAFLGTRLLEEGQLIGNFTKVLDCASRLQMSTGFRFRMLDVGGGFGVPLYEGERAIDKSSLRLSLDEIFSQFRDRSPWTGTLAVESGRYLAANCGVLLVRVIDVKTVHNERFAIVDGGINVIGGRDGYIGAKPTPMRLVGARGGRVEAVTVCGPLCTPADRLAVKVALPMLEAGDLLALYVAGAYGSSASPGLFLGRGFPREVFFDGTDFSDALKV